MRILKKELMMDIIFETNLTKIEVRLDKYQAWAIVISRVSGQAYELTIPELLELLQMIADSREIT